MPCIRENAIYIGKVVVCEKLALKSLGYCKNLKQRIDHIREVNTRWEVLATTFVKLVEG
jgi:hypothetical protein